MEKDAALLIVDVQNDFCPGGALPVAAGDLVVEPLNRAARLFATAGLPVLASRDWHPPISSHFRGYGGIWPTHCVQGNHGADFHPGLRLPPRTLVISKGNDPGSDGYSAFDGRGDDGRTLEEILESLGVRQLYIGGLASDYCVRSTALEAHQAGFTVTVLSDAIAGVDVSAGDSQRALDELVKAGVKFCTVDDLQRCH